MDNSNGIARILRLSVAKKLGIIFVLALSLGLVNKAALADGVTIQNASFETPNALTETCLGPGTCLFNYGPIPGWTMTGSGGSFEPSSAYFSLPLPDGNIVAYTNGGTISQDLGVGAQANYSYELSVFVGNRLDGENTTYSIALVSGSTTLCSFSGSNTDITPGTFADETCSFESGVPTGDLSILLTGGGPQADFDDVSLTDTPVSTPEPSSLALTGSGLLFVGLLVAYAKRKQSILLRLT